jgi:hypothetical protein
MTKRDRKTERQNDRERQKETERDRKRQKETDRDRQRRRQTDIANLCTGEHLTKLVSRAGIEVGTICDQCDDGESDCNWKTL